MSPSVRLASQRQFWTVWFRIFVSASCDSVSKRLEITAVCHERAKEIPCAPCEPLTIFQNAETGQGRRVLRSGCFFSRWKTQRPEFTIQQQLKDEVENVLKTTELSGSLSPPFRPVHFLDREEQHRDNHPEHSFWPLHVLMEISAGTAMLWRASASVAARAREILQPAFQR